MGWEIEKVTIYVNELSLKIGNTSYQEWVPTEIKEKDLQKLEEAKQKLSDLVGI